MNSYCYCFSCTARIDSTVVFMCLCTYVHLVFVVGAHGSFLCKYATGTLRKLPETFKLSLQPCGHSKFCMSAHGFVLNSLYFVCSILKSVYMFSLQGKTESCTKFGRFSSYRRSFGANNWYNRMESSSRRGCRRICQVLSWDSKCCKNHFGRDCEGKRRWVKLISMCGVQELLQKPEPL